MLTAAQSPPANDNADLLATPEGSYFQILKARRRHLRHDTSRMTPERLREWRRVLALLDKAECEVLAWLRQSRSAPPARRRPFMLARLRVILGRLLAGGQRR
jgi:hypothetical protein